MKPLTTHEEFCLKNAAHFVAARGRTPATRTHQQFATLPEAQAFGAAIGDGRKMIYAVTPLGHSAHITNARPKGGQDVNQSPDRRADRQARPAHFRNPDRTQR